jgi:dihydrofolate reductase
VYIACSLDGFIAGPGDDLSWLPQNGTGGAAGDQPTGAVDYDTFIADVGALLMGRRTYDVVLGFGIPWPFGERPVLVATHRPLSPPAPTVRPVTGDIHQVVAAAREAARGKDVYLDGGLLIRQALDAGLVDHLIVTFAPVVLGAGHPLFAGVAQRHAFEIVGHHRYGAGMLQVHLRPIRR